MESVQHADFFEQVGEEMMVQGIQQALGTGTKPETKVGKFEQNREKGTDAFLKRVEKRKNATATHKNAMLVANFTPSPFETELTTEEQAGALEFFTQQEAAI